MRCLLQVRRKLPSGLMDQVNKAVVLLEKELGKSLAMTNPLLVSVRSGRLSVCLA